MAQYDSNKALGTLALNNRKADSVIADLHENRGQFLQLIRDTDRRLVATG